MLAARGLWAAPPGAATAAVRGVTLEVAPGEWVALAGPNGCGKSTLALAMAGLWPTSRGLVTWQGAPLPPNAAGRAAARIATILQEPSSQLFERTVGDEIAFAARNLGGAAADVDAAVREWAERLGLAPFLGRDPHALSAGMQQRVLLAGALASRPAALVADEPTAHMDEESRTRSLEVVREQVGRGLPVLWVTQDEDECRAADRVVRMADPGAPAVESVRRTLSPASAPVASGSACIRVDVDPPIRSGEGATIRIPGPLVFELRAGAPLALVGANGTGKTVLLEAIAGVRPHPQVRVSGVPSGPGPVLAAQHPDLQVFGSTVAEELSWAATARGGDAPVALERATELFVRLQLDRELLARTTWALSAGERRLVQIVAALVTPASAVLIDEPTCGVDPVRAAALGHVLGDHTRSIPLVVATQDRAFSARIRASLQGLGLPVRNVASTYGKTD